MSKILMFAIAVVVVGGLFSNAAWAQGAKGAVDPAFAAWYYPNSDQIGASTFSGKMHKTLLTTPDDVFKVERFYLKQSHHPIAEKLDPAESPFGIHSTMGYPHPKDKDKQILAFWADDSKVRTDGEGRGVTIRSMVYDTPDELVTVTISRTPSEKTTHILLFCVKKK